MIHMYSTTYICLQKEKRQVTTTINGNKPALQYTITKRNKI